MILIWGGKAAIAQSREAQVDYQSLAYALRELADEVEDKIVGQTTVLH